MKKDKKIKIYLGVAYFIIVILFLWVIFSKFTFDELSSYDFIKNNRDYLISLKDSNIFSKEDMSHSILNMVGEIIGTIGYLNAGLFGINNIHFLGRVSLNKVVKNSILERLKLANIKGLFEDNREYGTVIGALKHIETK